MTELDYSLEARNVLNQFHEVQKLVYVEGDDDVRFWQILFEEFASFTVRIEGVGGKEELQKLIGDVVGSDADFLIAMDADFDYLFESNICNRILQTYGYSIENCLISNESLSSIMKNLGKSFETKESRAVPAEWLSHFSTSISQLILTDVIDRHIRLGNSVVPDCADRFMESKTACRMCNNKVTKYLRGLAIPVAKETRSWCQDVISSSDRSNLQLIRGHFLFSAASRFLRVEMKKKKPSFSMPNDMFLAMLYGSFENLVKKNKDQFCYYQKQIESINL